MALTRNAKRITKGKSSMEEGGPSNPQRSNKRGPTKKEQGGGTSNADINNNTSFSLLSNLKLHVCTYLAAKGGVVTWGNGQAGQLGHGDLRNLNIPNIVRELQFVHIISVSAGWSHTAFVSESRKLYTCGAGGFGQLGHGNFESCSVPRSVEALWFAAVSRAACGMRHTLVLTELGMVYAFGSSKRGQLGVGCPAYDRESHVACMPINVVSLNDYGIVAVYANGDHSAALTGTGAIFLWGKNFGGIEDQHIPLLISEDLKFWQLALGWNHILAVTDTNHVYMAGRNWGCVDATSRLAANNKGGSNDVIVNTPEPQLHLFEPLRGQSARWVAAGSEHSIVSLDDGRMLTWGWGEHGQLGIGSNQDQSLPQLVAGLPQLSNCGVFCGSGFTFVVKNIFP